MKKIYSLLVMMVLSLASFAQHLNFMGVELNGKIDDFCNKLVEKNGFVVEGHEGLSYILSMPQNPTCLMIIPDYENIDLAYEVDILYECSNNTNWEFLESMYQSLKSSMIEKFGEPESESHSFSVSVPNDAAKFNAIKNGSCNYSALFDAGAGMVMVVPAFMSDTFYIRLAFVDVQNFRIVTENDKQ